MRGSRSRTGLVLGAVVLLVVWVRLPWLLEWMMARGGGMENAERLGQVGDMYGVLNSLCSGLALIGAIYAIIEQTRSAEEQGGVMREIALALERQASALKVQAEAAREQVGQLTIAANIASNSAEMMRRTALADYHLKRVDVLDRRIAECVAAKRETQAQAKSEAELTQLKAERKEAQNAAEELVKQLRGM